mmetsp:Transcript_17102/g.46247  ORF Transcript_17102/g.46247 Transcript_17102/m.46247 type:complete len:737 (-) Transcript_17102:348-2558(-)
MPSTPSKGSKVKQLDDAVDHAAEDVFTQLRAMGIASSRDEFTLPAIAAALWTHRGGGASQQDAADKFGVSRRQVSMWRWHMWQLVDAGGTMPVHVFDTPRAEFLAGRAPPRPLAPLPKPMRKDSVQDFSKILSQTRAKAEALPSAERASLCTPALLSGCSELLALRDEALQDVWAQVHLCLQLIQELCAGASGGHGALLEHGTLDAVVAFMAWARVQPHRASDEGLAKSVPMCALVLATAASEVRPVQEWVWGALVPDLLLDLLADESEAVRTAAHMIAFACAAGDGTRLRALAGSAEVLREIAQGARRTGATGMDGGQEGTALGVHGDGVERVSWPRALVALMLRSGLGSVALRTLRAAAPQEVQAARKRAAGSAASASDQGVPGTLFGGVCLTEALEEMLRVRAGAGARHTFSGAVVGELSAECSALLSTMAQWEPERYLEAESAGPAALRAEPLLMLRALTHALGTAVASGESGADAHAKVHGLVTRAGAMLAKLVAWAPPGDAGATGEGSPAFELKSSLVRLVGALCFGDARAQEEVRRDATLRPLLACCAGGGARDPGLRQEAVLALFTACQGRPEFELLLAEEVKRLREPGRAARRGAARQAASEAVSEAEAELRAAELASLAAESRAASIAAEGAEELEVVEAVRTLLEADVTVAAKRWGVAFENVGLEEEGDAEGGGDSGATPEQLHGGGAAPHAAFENTAVRELSRINNSHTGTAASSPRAAAVAGA